jgi:cytochrome c553
MSRIVKKISVLTISLLVAGPIRADDLPVLNCGWCHGMSGQGYSKAPRLAGQTKDYLVNQLRAFTTHERDETLGVKYMWNATAHLDPLTADKLAAYFSALPPEAAKDGESDLVAKGKAIYENGVPDENIPACQACHGPEAQGVREIPRLGGLSFLYLRRRLEDWAQGRDAWGTPMPKIAAYLSPNQIAALASFMSFVEVRSSER